MVDLYKVVDKLVCLLDGAKDDVWRLCLRQDGTLVRVYRGIAEVQLFENAAYLRFFLRDERKKWDDEDGHRLFTFIQVGYFFGTRLVVLLFGKEGVQEK